MISLSHKIVCVAAAAAVTLCLAGCGRSAQENAAQTVPQQPTAAPVRETTAPTVDPMELVEDLTVVMEAGELYTLDHYPNLRSVDLSGSTCYSSILEYLYTHPQINVTYTVSLGKTEIANSATAITLNPGDFDAATLLENLQYLPNLTAITLADVSLNAEEISAIQEAYPSIVLEYTVDLLGQTYDIHTTELDLSSLSDSQVDEAVSKLGLLTNLTSVDLNNNLSKGDVARLQNANPNATFHYSFKLFGQSLSTTDETVLYKNYSIGNDGEEEIRQALEILDNCSRFVLDNCNLDYEVLAGIREDFRDGPNVVWRVYFGKDYRYNALTDDEVIRAVYNVTDETVSPLKYCEGAKYIDMGHNDTLTDLSFVSGMPNLEVFIGSGCAVKELVGFENCKMLTWLELASCYKLENIDSLAGCESLTYLNLCYSKVTNYMALDSLPLERFICLSPKASTEEQNIFVQIHEGCRTVFYGYSNPWTPWRYDDNGKTYNAYYKNVVRKAFNYDYLETLLPKEE